MENTQKYLFNYCTFSLSKYKGDNRRDSVVLRTALDQLKSSVFAGEKKIIDKHEHQENSLPRKLINLGLRPGKKGSYYFGKIALIKNNIPSYYNRSNEQIEKLLEQENKDFIEITNYVLSFRGERPVIMYEFNSEGPRINDIQFYFRHVLKILHVSYGITKRVHLDITYEALEKELTNVFGFSVKVKSGNAINSGWYEQLKNISLKTGFKDIRIDMSFKKESSGAKKTKKNYLALDYIRDLLGWLKIDEKNIERLDDLKMSYEAKNDEYHDFDFLSNKKSSKIEVELNEKKEYDTKIFREELIKEFNYYLKNGTTNLSVRR